MPIQPLEIYDVEDNGALILKHKDLKDALITSKTVMIVNHEDKSVILWIGKGSKTNVKFAASRSSRHFLSERGLNYRIKTCDEGEEPDWFRALFTMKVTEQLRDEPPTPEILSILSEMKAVKLPEGFEREACIISRDFYVPVEYKSSIMGIETSGIKFEKGTFLPEGFFMLPSRAYCPRLLVKNGKVLGIDILFNQELTKQNVLIELSQLDSNKPQNHFESLQKTIRRKDEEIKSLREEIVKKDERIKSIQNELTKKDQQVETLQTTKKKRDQQIETLQKTRKQKEQESEIFQDSQSQLKEKDQKLETFQSEVTKKDQQVEPLQTTRKKRAGSRKPAKYSKAKKSK